MNQWRQTAAVLVAVGIAWGSQREQLAGLRRDVDRLIARLDAAENLRLDVVESSGFDVPSHDDNMVCNLVNHCGDYASHVEQEARYQALPMVAADLQKVAGRRHGSIGSSPNLGFDPTGGDESLYDGHTAQRTLRGR